MMGRIGLIATTAMMTGAALAMAAPAAAGAQNVKAGVDAWGKGDFKAAVDQWRGPAVAGDADAQFNLGQAYKLGRGVPLDPALAESWFRKAALQGHFQAEDNYGLALFQSGKKAEALPWLEKSVARGEPRGELVLGTMLFNGDGVPRDYPRAYALMTLAQQAGLKSASETLAQMDQYISPPDREKGIALAQQYAARPKPLPRAGSGSVGNAPPPPGQRVGGPERLPPSHGPARAPAPTAGPRPVPTPVAAAPRPAPVHPSPARPVPKPAAAVPERATGGGWKIQLGAFSSQANAQSQWSQVRGRLGGAQPFYPHAGTVIRLQAGGYPTKAAAQRACAASKVSCVVVAP